MKRLFLILVLVLFSCGIENPESAMEFGAPLGLEAIVSNDGIFLSFYGFNNETYFEGYNIYISENKAELENFSVLGRRILSNETATNKPTIEQTPFSSGPRTFTFFLTKDYYTTTNNTSVMSETLLLSNTYFFTVRAYGNGIISRKYANIATCFYVTN
ncbi:MAG: hypothetical protein ACP5QT_06790 [Brevinematia bacterium]